MTGGDLGEFLNLVHLIATMMGILVQDSVFEVAGERKYTFKYDSSSLKWRVYVLSSFRQYQGGQQWSCATPWGRHWFSVECGWGATSPACVSNPCDGLTSPSCYHIAHKAVAALSVLSSLLIPQDVSGTGGGKPGLWEGWTLKENVVSRVSCLTCPFVPPSQEAHQQEELGCTAWLCPAKAKASPNSLLSMNSSSGLCTWLRSSARDEAINQ